jgi:hypothetical protein
MSDKLFTYVFNFINTQTALIMAKYEESEDLLNNLHSEMLIDVGDKPQQGFINYLIKLISFCEAKEDYEKCAMLLKLKNKIKNYKND